MVNTKQLLQELGQYAPFDNAEWQIRVRGSTDSDKRLMTFVDNLWGFEVTGGTDQFEPLTVIAVKRSGLARRAGIRVNDVINKINDIDASTLTLRDCQEIIQQCGRHLKIYVAGEDDDASDDEMTADCWFKPLSDAERALLDWEARQRRNRNPGKWNDVFPWNDRKKVVYRESNCPLVPSQVEEKIQKIREIKLNIKSEERQSVSPCPQSPEPSTSQTS
uniref:CSON000967 protein n=1 Tax=Culicoides sonorensis TaxID=179676 RepID=A0A336LR65_CULSO